MSETQPVSNYAERGKDHFESAINELDNSEKAKLEVIKTHLSESPFVIGKEDSELTRLIGEANDAHIPFPFTDYVILDTGIQSKKDKEEYLRSRHDRYFDSWDYPAFLILALSQGLDLKEVYPEQAAKNILIRAE